MFYSELPHSRFRGTDVDAGAAIHPSPNPQLSYVSLSPTGITGTIVDYEPQTANHHCVQAVFGVRKMKCIYW